MKVALLLYGQPRGIDKEDVWLSHKRFILDKYDTDVYAHMWFDSDATQFEMSSHATNMTATVIPNSDTIIRERYAPIEMKVESPRQFQCEAYIGAFETGGKYKCSSNFPNYISQLYSVEEVAKLCIQSNIKYDMIVVARYDTVIDEFPELDELNPNFFYHMNHHPKFPDIFFLFSHKFLESQLVFTGLEERIRKNLDTGYIWEPFPECMKFLKYIDIYPIKYIRSIEIKEHRLI